MLAAFWNLVARFLARPRVREWLWKRAERTPYTHITSPDGKDVYMGRWWLFNPYDNETRQTKYRWCPDSDRHLHDHPWNARSIILAGGYVGKYRGTWGFLVEDGKVPYREYLAQRKA
jgi:hypothetical protein